MASTSEMVTVFNKKTGAPHQTFSVDAAELLASGEYVSENPKEKKKDEKAPDA